MWNAHDIGVALIALGIFGMLFYIPLLLLLLIPGVLLVIIDRLFLTRKCPFCSEKIKRKDEICPHCKQILPSQK